MSFGMATVVGLDAVLAGLDGFSSAVMVPVLLLALGVQSLVVY